MRSGCGCRTRSRSSLVDVERHRKMIVQLLAQASNRVHAALLHCFRGCAREIDDRQRGIEGSRTEPIIVREA